MPASNKRTKRKRGPKPERVKIEGDWEDAVKKALEKKRPKGGWPKHEKPDDDEEEDQETT